MGGGQRLTERTFGQRGFSRTGMSDLPHTMNIQQASPVTGHSTMLCVYRELYHSKNDHQANFPPLSFSFLATVLWYRGTGNADGAVGGTLAPRLPLPTQDCSQHLLPVLMAPSRSSHFQLPRQGVASQPPLLAQPTGLCLSCPL